MRSKLIAISIALFCWGGCTAIAFAKESAASNMEYGPSQATADREKPFNNGETAKVDTKSNSRRPAPLAKNEWKDPLTEFRTTACFLAFLMLMCQTVMAVWVALWLGFEMLKERCCKKAQ
ncbi:MAG TPA: hypothetical protein V6C81_12495 [Planktothrix sp.]|jgi:hypothetical protein